MKVAMFQLIRKMPNANPTMAVLRKLLVPKYSGVRKSESAPKLLRKCPVTVENRMYQIMSSSWCFRK
jgi:hypothetical protein